MASLSTFRFSDNAFVDNRQSKIHKFYAVFNYLIVTCQNSSIFYAWWPISKVGILLRNREKSYTYWKSISVAALKGGDVGWLCGDGVPVKLLVELELENRICSPKFNQSMHVFCDPGPDVPNLDHIGRLVEAATMVSHKIQIPFTIFALPFDCFLVFSFFFLLNSMQQATSSLRSQHKTKKT